MKTFLQELRQALRGLLARPAFSALVVGVLGAGLGCVVFMLALLDGLVMRPLPFRQPEQLMQAGYFGQGDLGDVFPVTDQDLLKMREHLAGVADLAGVARSTVNLSDLDRPERFNGAHVSANLFGVLGVAPMLGRDFVDADNAPGAPVVAMISYSLWQSRYGGNPDVVGKALRVDAAPATVIGVMPPDFSFPRREQVWVNMPLVSAAQHDAYRYWTVLRRKPETTVAQVETAVQSWFDDAAKAQPDLFRNEKPRVEALADMVTDRTTRSMLGMMLASVFMVLLIACANAANLLLTRLLGRSQEMAIRAALGAGCRRLLLQLFAQSLVLSMAALALALLLARLGLRWQQIAAGESEFSLLWLRLEISPTVLALAFGATLLTALASGVLPALQAARSAPAAGLRDGGARTAGGRGFARVSRVLVVGEIVLSCALVLCVGTLVRGIRANENIGLGIDTQHLLTARVLLPTSRYANPVDQTQLFERLSERLNAEPAVAAASVGTALPGTYYNEVHGVVASGETLGDAAAPEISTGAVDDHFLAAYGMQLQEGRFFDAGDKPDGLRVAVVDRRFADTYGATGSLIGREFRLDPKDETGPTVRIVGVIPALTLDAPGDAPRPSLLMPLRQAPFRIASIGVRTRGDALAFAPRLAQVMREVDADTPLYWVRDYAAVRRQMSYGERVMAQSFGAFGVIALLLAAAGLYGVMAFAVSQRTREIGVRRALGAARWSVLRSVFALNLAQLGIGLGLGLAAGVGLSYQLSRSLHTIPPGGALVAIATAVVLALAALLAALVPAARALRVNPIEALRHE
jgi:putative ABC transport system permease protein